MKKRTILDSALTPDGQCMELVEHDAAYSLRVGGVELMSTRQHASEEELARMICEPLAGQTKPRVLIGGLGFGYTLKAALRLLPPGAVVTVAELIPAVVTWNRDPAYPLAGEALTDPRVTLVERDVHQLIQSAKASYDGIILDVDNGADALVTGGNQKLYHEVGLHLVKNALTLGGRVAYWSASANPRFRDLMGRVGMAVQVQRCRSNGAKGSWHNIYVGRRLRA